MVLQSFTWVTIILCFVHVSAVPITCGLQRRLVDKSHSLLESMSGLFPVECLEHNLPIAFPSSAFKTSETAESGGAEKAAYETLKLIDTLFANDSMPTSWNNLEDFQDIIYRQIEESECVSQTASDYKDNSICYNSIFLNLILLSRLNQIMSKTQSSEDSPARNATLKMYFDKIATVLKEKESSDCAWEVVRKEILYTLKFILQSSSYLI
ncbi:interferon alpha-1-like [Clupea harengus]|uniref:Interferon alpha-1-like n=1 Tax=Clupea harengus TaxID=7950 RepID=A0A8M1KRM1_CLUHA|nr:interferon alpha-1-like [Clupea harengus]